MTAALLFILSALVFLIIALALVLPTLFRRPSDDDKMMLANERIDNINAAHERMHRLQAALATAEIDKEQADDYAKEIETSLLQDVSQVAVPAASDSIGQHNIKQWVGITIVVSTLLLMPPLLYGVVGSPATWMATTDYAVAEKGEEAPDMDTLVERLQQRLLEEPGDVEALYWLGRLSTVREEYLVANDYLAQARALAGNTPDLLVATINNLMLDDHATHATEINQLLESGLQIAPSNPTLLWLAGLNAESKGQLTLALNFWRQAYEHFTDSPDSQQQVARVIADIEQQLATTPTESVATPPASDPSVEPSRRDSVIVVVDIEGNPVITTGAVLFVFAKAAGEGAPPMPLAVHKQGSPQFPLTVSLHDGLAMLPTMKMSDFETYEIVARLSASGNAIAASGDHFGAVKKVTAGSQITVVIDQTVP